MIPLLLLLFTGGAAYALVKHSSLSAVLGANTLVGGRWYCVTVKVTPLISPSASLVQTRATTDAAFWGFVDPMAVLPAQAPDGTWMATVTAQYQGHTGMISNTEALTILKVEEVRAPPSPLPAPPAGGAP